MSQCLHPYKMENCFEITKKTKTNSHSLHTITTNACIFSALVDSSGSGLKNGAILLLEQHIDWYLKAFLSLPIQKINTRVTL